MDIMTAAEKARLEGRLRQLISNRSVISERIAEARALGDLKENAEYHAARELQGMEEAEIRRLEDRLARAQVIDEAELRDAAVVFLGSTVKLRNLDTGADEVVKLVGEFSADEPDEYDEVTVTSPMGEALLKARVGETIRYSAPRGVKRYEIMELL